VPVRVRVEAERVHGTRVAEEGVRLEGARTLHVEHLHCAVAAPDLDEVAVRVDGDKEGVRQGRRAERGKGQCYERKREREGTARKAALASSATCAARGTLMRPHSAVLHWPASAS
jgi:hypothetical protein